MYFLSIHCRAGEHDKCRDGAAIQCPCNCGHRRFRQEGEEQRSWYEELLADEAEMDRRIIEQRKAARREKRRAS